jgi:hypothetical protein
MGATNIDYVIKGKANKTEIDKSLRLQQEKDREYNGHQEGYSGDFQTVGEIKLLTKDVFDNQQKAEEYCLDNAQKWDFVVAAYFHNSKGEIDTLVCGWGAC